MAPALKEFVVTGTPSRFPACPESPRGGRTLERRLQHILLDVPG